LRPFPGYKSSYGMHKELIRIGGVFFLLYTVEAFFYHRESEARVRASLATRTA
jgi:hypothetical protein